VKKGRDGLEGCIKGRTRRMRRNEKLAYALNARICWSA